VEVLLTKPGYRSGHLFFCEFDRQGVILEPRQGGSYLSVYRHQSALRNWWQSLHGTPTPAVVDPPGPVYQLQLFVESYEPLTADEREQARMLFLKGFEKLRPHSPPEERTDQRQAMN
jgi:hypothetical protein